MNHKVTTRVVIEPSICNYYEGTNKESSGKCHDSFCLTTISILVGENNVGLDSKLKISKDIKYGGLGVSTTKMEYLQCYFIIKSSIMKWMAKRHLRANDIFILDYISPKGDQGCCL